ncbi:biopolymer ExbD/TolR family transporter [Caballeronia sordidicola]|uniref:Biopolymer ExbD/TolR family transporter n=1 Tax=Caballeronia sordidicola TaxID=196367 RepID=A0A158HMM3_CABSO|nr:biopolymer ExbD/TolR family transporter [Caballeronia sordidicola]
MAMSPFSDDEDDDLMGEINMTPLVDVMLVC